MRSNQSVQNSSFIHLQNDKFLQRQRIAGKIAANTLTLLENLVKEKTKLTLIELDKLAEEFIRKNDCVPTFLNYHNFPNSVCISVNNQLVHGVPTNYSLQEGDVVTFDLGATFEGAIADTALTCIYGEVKNPMHLKGIEITNLCLEKAIAAVSVGKRIGVIGHTIHKTAKENGFDVIETYGGHGIQHNTPHAQPFISNKAQVEEGINIQPNMTIAIEPLLFPLGHSNKTKIDKDGWTVFMNDICFHSEHTVYIHPDRVEIITERK